jgi:hypothetical protein
VSGCSVLVEQQNFKPSVFFPHPAINNRMPVLPGREAAVSMLWMRLASFCLPVEASPKRRSPFSTGSLGLCLVPIYAFAFPASGNRDLEICGRRYIQRSLYLLETYAHSFLVSFRK